jgi:hypothetical protein
MSIYERILASTIYMWFEQIVLPIWNDKDIVMEMYPSPKQLEKDLLIQASKCSTFDIEDNKLFYSANIAYYAFENVVEKKERENGQRSFIGTEKISQLFVFLYEYYKPIHLSMLKKRETEKSNRIARCSYIEKTPSPCIGGYRHSNGYSCLCLFCDVQLIILEDLCSHNKFIGQDGRKIIKGGLTFLFINPKYAFKGVQILHEILCQQEPTFSYHNAVDIMRVFINTMTLFVFPSKPQYILMDCKGMKLITDFKKLIQIYFPDTDVYVSGGDKMTLVCDVDDTYFKTVTSYSNAHIHLRIEDMTFFDENHEEYLYSSEVNIILVPCFTENEYGTFYNFDNIDNILQCNISDQWLKEGNNDVDFSPSYKNLRLHSVV